MKRLLRSVTRFAAAAGGLIALIVGLLTVYSIGQRSILTRPLHGDIELVQFGIALSISLCLGWCQLRRANIIVDFFTVRAPVAVNRLLDGIGCALLALMYGLLAVRTLYGAMAVRAAHETTPTLDLPTWWVYACLAPGLALAAWVAVVQAWILFSGDDIATLSGAADQTPSMESGA